MFDNITWYGLGWVCYCDDDVAKQVGSVVMYAGCGTDSVTGADEYWG